MREIHDAGTPNEENVGIGHPAADTCGWIYDRSNSNELQPWREWRDSEDSSIMLLTGDIGTGKSTLTLNVIDVLRNRPSLDCRLVSAAFCRDQAAYNSCEAILRGLLYGIARHDREARDNLVRYRDSSNLAKVGMNFNAFTNFESLSECFKKCVENRKKELCLVVDGLDECEELSRLKLLRYITTLVKDAQRLASSPPLKVLFISRPINTITNNLPSTKKLDMGDVRKAEETRRIIEHLIKSKLSQLDEAHRPQVAVLLEEKADGCMQWATVVVEHLNLVGARDFHNIERELEDLSDGPNGLDGTYTTLYRRHFGQSLAGDANIALRLVAGAARSLSIDELANAMIVHSQRFQLLSKDDFKKEAKPYWLTRLQPFVRISSQASRIFMHNSLKALMSRTPHLGTPSNMNTIDSTISNLALSTLLAKTCLDFLLLPYFRTQDVWKDFDLHKETADWLMHIQTDSDGNEDAGSEIEGDRREERENGPAFFTYAAEHWATHLSDTDFHKDLIEKSRVLSEAGSMQCYNWWAHCKTEDAWAPQQMSQLLAAIWFAHKPAIEVLLKDFRDRSSNSPPSKVWFPLEEKTLSTMKRWLLP
ncbi:hypothetical protein EJ08DRAFT_490822 [Tothia fuscella]|uniref:Nephrocystin 3-like N-terminal domain-containing protein n=1 Tax=Tothia fuscella TaxID=1048955 RepID=A0A9P4TU29_9PEZI|nr:hypothetical protein EJ08DRAFT_490822 [Tothia fuscella]